MANLKIDSGERTDMNNLNADNIPAVTSTFKVDVLPADSTSEEEYTQDWNQWNGYYESIPALNSIINRKAMWTVGKGFKADARTTDIINKWKGNGKDTANTIFYNGVVVYTTGGDFYAEIVKSKRGVITNLKPLNPGTVKIIATKFGTIDRYEVQPLNSKGKAVQVKRENMFHLQWNRVADQIHGNSTIKKLKETVSMYNEAKKDLRVVFHRYVKPLLIFSVDTDDTGEIAAFKVKVDKSVELGENMVLPKDTVDNVDRVSIPQFSTLDPLPWIKSLEEEFVKAEGVPGVILGSSSEATEATAKILYLAFQQMVEWNQLFLEQQIKSQLNLEVKFEFPASIAPDLIADEGKDSPQDSNKDVEGSTSPKLKTAKAGEK